MVYRHKIGLIKTVNQKIVTTVATLLILVSPLLSTVTALVPQRANAAQITDKVVINEIKPATGTAEKWVELYNPTASTVNMSSWRLVRETSPGNYSTFTTVFTAGTTLAPHSYHTVTSTSAPLPQTSNGPVQLWTNTPGTSGTQVDSVDYGSGVAIGGSYARIYDASTDFEVRSDTNVTKNASNGSAPVPFAPPTAASSTTQVIRQADFANSMSTWTYQDDNTSVATPSATENHKITANPSPSLGNSGAVRLQASESGQRWNLASLQYSGKKLADIAALGFDIYTDSPSSAYLNLDIDFNHSSLSGWQGRLVYIPVGNTASSWSSQEAVASNGLWKWSRMVTGAVAQWPDGNAAESRTWNDIMTAFPEARLTGIDNAAFGSLYLRTDGVSTTYYDNVYLATSSQNITYNFEQTFSGGTSAFIGSPKYVRADHANDTSGAVRVPGEAEAVRFNFTGAHTLSQTVGVDDQHTQAGQWPNAQGERQFRAHIALPAGAYNLTAEYQVDDTWYPVTGDTTAYSLDLPWATYAIPSSTAHIFRSSDNPVRVRVDDQYYQFKHLLSTVNGVTFAVLREQCDLRQAGNYLLCDVNTATSQTIGTTSYPAWIPLAEGSYTATTTTYTQANNRKDDIVSLPFIIDTTRPTLSNFVITTPQSTYGSVIDVSADASDANGVEYVKFYLTSPRISDGACDGNGTQQRIEFDTIASGTTYHATFDTSVLNGEYCLNAVAKDNSSHSSQPILRLKVSLDNAAPIWNADPVHSSPLNDAVVNEGDEILMQWEDATDASTVSYYYNVSALSPETEGSDNHLTYPFYMPFGPFTVSQMSATGTAPGTYYWQVKACDALGNCTPWTDPWKGSVVSEEEEETQTPTTSNNTPSQGSSGSPSTFIATSGAPITPTGTFQNFGFVPTQITDEVVSAQPNTAEVLGVTDEQDSGNILGAEDSLAKNAPEATNGVVDLMGANWYWILAGLGTLGHLWWIVAAKRRHSAQ